VDLFYGCGAWGESGVTDKPATAERRHAAHSADQLQPHPRAAGWTPTTPNPVSWKCAQVIEKLCRAGTLFKKAQPLRLSHAIVHDDRRTDGHREPPRCGAGLISGADQRVSLKRVISNAGKSASRKGGRKGGRKSSRKSS
jgi:hypothetical protein